MPLQRTVWRGKIDGVEYRLVSCAPRTSLETDRIVARYLDNAVVFGEHQAATRNGYEIIASGYAQNIDAEVPSIEPEPELVDGVARWRSEEELGFAPRRRAQPTKRAATKGGDDGPSIADDEVSRMWSGGSGGYGDPHWEP